MLCNNKFVSENLVKMTEKEQPVPQEVFNESGYVYDDSFCRITANGQLIIKCYYFPFAQKLTLNIEDIQAVWYKTPEVYLGKYKGWGEFETLFLLLDVFSDTYFCRRLESIKMVKTVF